MVASKNDLTRLIQFSLDKYKFATAVTAFPMFTAAQIKQVYAMTTSARKQILKDRASADTAAKQRRSAEQVHKMGDIATDPSNR